MNRFAIILVATLLIGGCSGGETPTSPSPGAPNPSPGPSVSVTLEASTLIYERVMSEVTAPEYLAERPSYIAVDTMQKGGQAAFICWNPPEIGENRFACPPNSFTLESGVQYRVVASDPAYFVGNFTPTAKRGKTVWLAGVRLRFRIHSDDNQGSEAPFTVSSGGAVVP